MEIREKIFEMFAAVDGNVRQPENCQFIQASPLIKGAWVYKSIVVKTITFYYTTSKIMLQGSGVQSILQCRKENYLDKCHELIAAICFTEVDEIPFDDLQATIELHQAWKESCYEKQEQQFSSMGELL